MELLVPYSYTKVVRSYFLHKIFLLGFDRVNYLKVLPQHFAEVLCLPENIRHCREKGGFVRNIRGTKMHAVAPDEAHEMLVNKDIETMQCSQALQRVPQPHHVLLPC